MEETGRGDAFEWYRSDSSPREGCGAKHPLRGRRGGLGDPQGVKRIEVGIGTSVFREAVTDAYGASTLRVPHG